MHSIPLNTSIRSISTAKSSHGRVYKSIYQFDLAELAASPKSWISVALKYMEERSRLNPFSPSDLDRFRRLLITVAGRSSLKQILLMETRLIGRQETQALFTGMEDCIEQEYPWSPAIRARASMDFRRYMEEFVPPDYFKESLQRSFVFFRTRFTWVYESHPVS